ncbi:MAG: metallophosphoesterase [Phycisphaerae bacterium]|nr:MAG: metallophosphoesterase [Phycisphaerae bacterium]
MLKTATTLPEPHAPSSWPWLEVGKIRRLKFPEYRLPVPNLPEVMEGLTILHLSDLHVHRTWMPAWDQLHLRIQESPPDLIVVTGDWVDCKHDHRPALPLLEHFIGGLQARLGVWGILGNHDGDLLPLRNRQGHVRLLCNERARLEQDGVVLELIGLHGVHPLDAVDRSLFELVGETRPDTLRIVLSHFPARVLELAEMGVELVLSGHTHGGQICLPGGIPILTHDALPRRFARGVHRIGNTWLVTSRGCGFSKYPLRIFCPAEAIWVQLTGTPQSS